MSFQTLIKLYEYLDNVTPLNTDCGKICNKKCCNGTNEDGMILFPYEKDLFINNDEFTIYYDKKYQMDAIRCNGNCSRNQRPLSCRIFPFMFYTVKDNIINTAPDIRAIDFCPILNDKLKVNKKFFRSMRISAKLISSDYEFNNFIIKLSDLLTDFNKL